MSLTRSGRRPFGAVALTVAGERGQPLRVEDAERDAALVDARRWQLAHLTTGASAEEAYDAIGGLLDLFDYETRQQAYARGGVK